MCVEGGGLKGRPSKRRLREASAGGVSLTRHGGAWSWGLSEWGQGVTSTGSF